MSAPDSRAPLRFGHFELDIDGCSLRKEGVPVRLERRPMDLLLLLVEHRHRLVSRNEIADRLWGAGVFVDAETGLNTAIRKVRQALEDRPERPAFIETVAGRGYRFIAEVESAEATNLTAGVVTLAVLPFEDLGANPDAAYIADGFTEESIAAIGQIDPEHLRVIGRTSVMAYRRTTRSIAEIGRDLGVTYLVEGSLRAEGPRWRITVKLIRVADQVQEWSASFDSEPSSMLEFQRELSTAIAEQIRLRLSSDRLSVLERRQSRNPEAYELYLRGRYLWNQHTPQTTRRAVECFARATELDPDYALAWSGLADAFASSPINADTRPLEVWPRARAAAARAIASGPALAETQTSVGLLKYWLDWDWPGAVAAYGRAIAIDPTYPFGYRMLGVTLGCMGRGDEARTAMRRARELDPLQPMNHALSAHVAFLGRDYDDGLRFARQAVAIGPRFWIAHFQLALVLERIGESEQALDALRRADAVTDSNSKMISLRGFILASVGRIAEAMDVVRTLEAIAAERYVPPYAIALVHAGLGQWGDALEWLERAFDAHDVHLIWLPEDPKWDPIRGDARFLSLVDRCRFLTGREHQVGAP